MIRIISSRKLRQLERDAKEMRAIRRGVRLNTRCQSIEDYAPIAGPCIVTGITEPICVMQTEQLDWGFVITALEAGE